MTGYGSEWAGRFSEMIDAHRRRKARRAAIAEAFKIARSHGITKRHAARMARMLVDRQEATRRGDAVRAAEHAMQVSAALRAERRGSGDAVTDAAREARPT